VEEDTREESLEEMLREVKEETGLEIESYRFIKAYQGFSLSVMT
jgi:8-oxo-dGTP pyrophosphatase MutT (NUDIX family)